MGKRKRKIRDIIWDEILGGMRRRLTFWRQRCLKPKRETFDYECFDAIKNMVYFRGNSITNLGL